MSRKQDVTERLAGRTPAPQNRIPRTPLEDDARVRRGASLSAGPEKSAPTITTVVRALPASATLADVISKLNELIASRHA